MAKIPKNDNEIEKPPKEFFENKKCYLCRARFDKLLDFHFPFCPLKEVENPPKEFFENKTKKT